MGHPHGDFVTGTDGELYIVPQTEDKGERQSGFSESVEDDGTVTISIHEPGTDISGSYFMEMLGKALGVDQAEIDELRRKGM